MPADRDVTIGNHFLCQVCLRMVHFDEGGSDCTLSPALRDGESCVHEIDCFYLCASCFCMRQAYENVGMAQPTDEISRGAPTACGCDGRARED